MIYTVKNTILGLNDFIDSLNFGIYFLVSIISIVFSFYVLYSIFFNKFGNKSKLEKILFLPALTISLVFIILMILAGDIYPKLSAEKTARYFAESLCNGRIEEVINRKNKVLALEYHDKFTADWKQKYKEFKDIYCDADDFLLIEYHYEYLDIGGPEKCIVVLRTSKILEIPQKGDDITVDDITECDYDFQIELTMLTIPSRFLGNYGRWRINNFFSKKSKSYTMQEWLDRIKKVRTKT